MAKIIPIRDLKNTSTISDMCHDSEEPIFVTKNGYADVVIMSNETYENQMKRIETYYKGLLEVCKKDIHLLEKIDDLTPEDTLEALMRADTPEEKFFYEMLGNMLIQKKQREVIAAGNLF